MINVEISCAALYFCGNRDIFYFSGFTDEQKVQKSSIYLKLCNIINVFTGTFDQFNASVIE